MTAAREPDLVDFVYEGAYALFKSLGADHDSAHARAEELCRGVQHRFGGGEHYVRAVDTSNRDAEIVNLDRQGVPQQTIADRLGVHRNTVRKVVQRARAAGEPSDSGAGLGRDEWVL